MISLHVKQIVLFFRTDAVVATSSQASRARFRTLTTEPINCENLISFAFVSIHILLFTTRKLYKVLLLTEDDESDRSLEKQEKEREKRERKETVASTMLARELGCVPLESRIVRSLVLDGFRVGISKAEFDHVDLKSEMFSD